jgi:glycosyltransferase involved in cell wall biosynthesis
MPLPIALDYRPALLSSAGIGRATRELARALSLCPELSVHLFGHSLARAKVPIQVPDTAHLHRLPIAGRALPALRRMGIGAELLAGNARVFHWTDYVQPPVKGARTVLTVHDLAFVRDPSWHGEQATELAERTRQAIARADALIVPSETTAKDVRAFAKDAPPLRVIPFGADHVPTSDRGPALAGRDYALCVGTIEPRKNHRMLLRAWRLLKEPRPLLVVIGAIGWACQDIVAELEEAEQAGMVQWHRQCSDAQLWPLLQHARLLAYPSLWEGFGFPPLEAMALGVPVIAHDTEPLRELGAEALSLCDASDPAALAAAVARMLEDDDYRKQRIAAGRMRAQSFGWRECAAAHAEVYREVAS